MSMAISSPAYMQYLRPDHNIEETNVMLIKPIVYAMNKKLCLTSQSVCARHVQVPTIARAMG